MIHDLMCREDEHEKIRIFGRFEVMFEHRVPLPLLRQNILVDLPLCPDLDTGVGVLLP
jgi:hypothetical protein